MFCTLRWKIYIGLILAIAIILISLSSLNCVLHMRLIYRDYIDKTTHYSEHLFSSIKTNLCSVEESTLFFKNKYDCASIVNSNIFNYDFNARHIINLPNSNLHIQGAFLYAPNKNFYFSSGIYANNDFKTIFQSHIKKNYEMIHNKGKNWMYIPDLPKNNLQHKNHALFYVFPLGKTDDDGYLIADINIDELANSIKIQQNIFYNEALTYLKFDNGFCCILKNTLSTEIDLKKLDNAVSGSTVDKCIVNICDDNNKYQIYNIVYPRYIYEQFLFITIIASLLNVSVITAVVFVTKPFSTYLLNPLERLHIKINQYTNNKMTGRESL